MPSKHMARARHIGKVVLLPTPNSRTTAAKPLAAITADGSYLVSGGLTGLGLATAEWLVERGARHLMLFGRRAPSPAAVEAIDAMRAKGAAVATAQADVSSEADLILSDYFPARWLQCQRYAA